MNSTAARPPRPTPDRTSATTRLSPLARVALVCTLLVLAGMGTTLAARTARAADASITIVRQDGLEAAYDAYLVFDATVHDDNRSEDIAWASDEMRSTVLAALDAQGYGTWFATAYPHSAEHDSPRAAAEFLASVLGGAGARRADPDLPSRAALANALAREIVGNDALLPETAHANEPFEGPQGYWLFVSDGEGTALAGTAPLFATMGAEPCTVVEKASSASLRAEVREDADGSWGQTADAQRGELVAHRLTVSLPQHLDAFDRYHCLVTCTLPTGMTLQVPPGTTCAEALSVRVGNRSATAGDDAYAASYEGNVLSIDLADLCDPIWSGAGLAENPCITIGFDAFLNGQAQVGSSGNLCRAQLTSTVDPVRGRELTTAPANTMVFCHGLDVQKVDGQTGAALPGAAFTLAERPKDGEASTTRYVQEDGSSGAQPHQFVTNDKGALHVPCLDAGSYLLRETAAPQGYTLPERGIELRIDAERRDESLSLGQVSVSLASDVADVASIDESNGIPTIRIRNSRSTPATPTTTTPAGGARPAETVQRLAQTGVGLLSVALVGAGLLLGSLGSFPVPSEGRKARHHIATPRDGGRRRPT